MEYVYGVEMSRASDWAEGLPFDLKNTQEPLWDASVDDPQCPNQGPRVEPHQTGKCLSTYSQFQFLRAKIKFGSVEHLVCVIKKMTQF